VPHSFNNSRELARTVPATLVLILLSVIGFLLVYLRAPVELISSLTFSDFRFANGEIEFLPHRGEYWRLLTPMFLHFSWLHITFNCLWLWELGALIERRLGTTMLLPLVLVSGVVSNVSQYVFGGPSLFGGMSGVVYALLGFCWVYNALLPARILPLPRAVIYLMLGWLVFCFVAPTELLGLGSIANAAHLAGLLCGCGSGLFIGLWNRYEGGHRQ
jgi:GlpG protein